MKILIVVIGILLAPAAAYGDGNELLENCSEALAILNGKSPNSREAISAVICSGYLKGIMHTNIVHQKLSEERLPFCIPEGGIKTARAARIVVKYLRNHREFLHQPQIALVFLAFQKAFPCT